MKHNIKVNHNNQKGFTLIEMILAVSILMLVFLAAGTGLMVVQQTWVKSQNRSGQLKKLILIDKIVNANFTNIVPFKWKDEQLKKGKFSQESQKKLYLQRHIR